MAQKKITDYQLRANVSDDVNFITDDGVQTYRNTAAQIKAYVLSTAAIATSVLQDLSVTAAKIALGAVTDDKTSFTKPTIQRFTTGSGTYTTPAGVKYIRVRMVGAGGGGGGANNPARPVGTAGGNTTFGTLTATGGAGGGGANLASPGDVGGDGGTATGGNILNINGTAGQGAFFISGSNGAGGARGGDGGNSFFGGGGSKGTTGNGSAATAPGSGGQGAGSNGSHYAASGGGSGAFVEHMFNSPAATYSYGVGAKGLGGGGINSGADGADGLIIVEEYYQ